MKPWCIIVVGLMLAGCGGGGGSSPPTGPGGSNHSPTVNLNIDKTVVSYGETATLSATTADPDGDQVTLAWSAGRGSVQASGPTATTATYTAPRSWGLDSAVVTASDGNGGIGRAAAQTYVRNPNPPAFTLGKATSSNCGPGGSIPEGFFLTISSPERVEITSIALQPTGCPSGTNLCYDIANFNPPITLATGQTYTWTECHGLGCCQSQSCGICGRWKVFVWGRRPAPDGGTFIYQCADWSGPGDTNCNF